MLSSVKYIYDVLSMKTHVLGGLHRDREGTPVRVVTRYRGMIVLYFPSDLVKIGHVMNQILKKWLGQIKQDN